MASTTPLPQLSPTLLHAHHVLIPSDNPFQQRARLLQALWRESRGLPFGLHQGEPLGSRLDLAHAKATLANFLTDTIRGVVRDVVLGLGRDRGALIREDRLFANLLSSQPLCFNLFAELARDLHAATRVVGALMPNRMARVAKILFEHSPGRGDPLLTGDRSAFDAFVEYDAPSGRRGFLGIEVKYHEALTDAAAEHRPRYDELADAMGCFAADRAALRRRPLQQIWRDHLLAGAMLGGGLGYDEGAFVFLYPSANEACARAIGEYRQMLTGEDTFAVWTLEDVVRAIAEVRPELGGMLEERYLRFDLGAAPLP